MLFWRRRGRQTAAWWRRQNCFLCCILIWITLHVLYLFSLSFLRHTRSASSIVLATPSPCAVCMFARSL